MTTLRTPLYQAHVALGARMVPFGGWDMPVQYASILDEARHVRTASGLFDLCHMGRVDVRGPASCEFLNRLVTNDVSKIKQGQIRYALLTREDGGVLDDVLVYHHPVDEGRYFVVINAGNRDKDLAWMREHATAFDCEVIDQSDELAMIALQGPDSERILAPHCAADLSELGYYRWIATEVGGLECTVSRTGYTGEDGFEIYYDAHEAQRIWDQVLGDDSTSIRPIGLGARDTLRLEAGMALYGHELSEEINPYEAGLAWAVKLNSGFIGAEALRKVKEEGPARHLVGLDVEGRRVPREGNRVEIDGVDVGWVASGTFSPVNEHNIATAFIDSPKRDVGSAAVVRIRDHEAPARVRALPFYKRDQ